jgi:hypothetical protein
MILLAAFGWTDLAIILVILFVAVGVTVIAAASDLFKLNVLDFNLHSARYPKKLRVDYWYTRASRRFFNTLTRGSWNWHLLKKRSRIQAKQKVRDVRTGLRGRLRPLYGRFSHDIALGALLVAIALVTLLLLRLL